MKNNNFKKLNYIIDEILIFYEKIIKNNFIFNFLFIFIIYFIISGFHFVKNDEISIISRFEKYNRIENPGLNWIFNGVEKIKIINKNFVDKIIIEDKFITLDKNFINIKINIFYNIKNYRLFLIRNNIYNKKIKVLAINIITKYLNKNNFHYILENKNILKNIINNEIKKELNKKNIINIKYIEFEKFKPINIVSKYIKELNESIQEKKIIIKNSIDYSKIEIDKYKKEQNEIIKKNILKNNNRLLKYKNKIDNLNEIYKIYKLYPKLFKLKKYNNFIKSIKNNKKIFLNKKSYKLYLDNIIKN